MSSPAAEDDRDIREYDRRVHGHHAQHRSQPQSHQSDIKPRVTSPSPSARSPRSSPLPHPRSMPSSTTHGRGADGSSSGSGSGSGDTMIGAGGPSAALSGSYPPAYPRSHHPFSARSPSDSSLSSHRSHPYPRRPSASMPLNDRDSARDRDLPRIHLPYPGSSGAPPTPSTGNVPPLSTLALDGSRDRATVPRTHTSNGGGMGRGLNLPPLHSLSSNSPPGHHQPYPYDRSPSDGFPRTHSPQLPHSSHGPPPTGRGSRGSPNLRPSYHYDAYPTPSHTSPIEHEPSLRHYPPPPDPYGRPSAHHSSLPPPSAAAHHPSNREAYRRTSPQDYPEPPSPPLRAVQHDYLPHAAHSHSHRPSSQSHHPYHQPHPGYYPPAEGYPHAHVRLGRSRSHSNSRMVDEAPAGPGQNRRIAHLMSEQKRRE
jgi:hypothetical protein